jgi:hypothetical protein
MYGQNYEWMDCFLLFAPQHYCHTNLSGMGGTLTVEPNTTSVLTQLNSQIFLSKDIKQYAKIDFKKQSFHDSPTFAFCWQLSFFWL